ncbi:hypothetical protein Tco_0884760 [Tanacetum coccineum]
MVPSLPIAAQQSLNTSTQTKSQLHSPSVTPDFKVRIYQKSQENSQKRTNTDTGIRRVQKKPRIQSRNQEKSTMVKFQSKVVKQSKKVKPWSTEVNH